LTVRKDFEANGITIEDENKFERVLEIVKDRCTLLTDFYQQASFFFKAPQTLDVASVKPKWNEDKAMFFDILSEKFTVLEEWNAVNIEATFKETAAEKNIKFGPAVFDIATLLGKAETINRIKYALTQF
jgi:glutamyl-tRNA synthetase